MISMVSSTGTLVKSDFTSSEAIIPFGRRTRKMCKKSSVELMMYLDGIYRGYNVIMKNLIIE